MRFGKASACREQRGTMSAEWTDFDLEQRLWTIPPAKRKTRKAKPSAHIVPLSEEVVRLLERRRALQPKECGWVFPALRSPSVMRGRRRAAIP